MSRLQPDPWQPERDRISLAVLGKLGEELNECGSAANRCIIQGIDEREPETGKLNREWLEDEIADVMATTRTAIAHFGLDVERIEQRSQRKIEHFKGWLALLAPVSTDTERKAS